MKSITFAILWILFWGWVCDITSDPSTFQVILFLVLGLGGPIGAIVSDFNRGRDY